MTAPLRIAVASGSHADDWTELTPPSAGRIERISVSDLGEASAYTARARRPVFVDVDVALADTVAEAFDEFAATRPGWTPGARVGVITHPGTVATLAGLLHDVWAAHVADGVTLLSDDPHELARVLHDDVAPLLATFDVHLAAPAASPA